MATINYAKKEISLKIVYYGPSLCGKTSSLQYIHESITPEQKGKLVSLATEGDRTLFFDFLPIELSNVKGFKVRLHLYTVPGQVHYNATRKAVLTGVDGVVFVADSQREIIKENIESLRNLEENLAYYGKNIKTTPLVFQYNKRDLSSILPTAEMNQILNPDNYPHFESIAITGEGINKVLTTIIKMVLKSIEKETGSKPILPESPTEESALAIKKADLQHLESIEEPKKEPQPSLTSVKESRIVEKPKYLSKKSAAIPQDKKRKKHISITGTGNTEIVSENEIRLPVKLKIDEDDLSFSININIRLETFIPED